MIEKYFRFIVLLIGTTVISCSEEIPLEIEGTEEIVVNCILTTDSIQELSLTHSKQLNEGIYFSGVDSANISLYHDENIVGTFVKNGSTTWQVNYTPILGESYMLRITIHGEEEITATTAMPLGSDISVVSNNNHINTFQQQNQNSDQWLFCLNSTENLAFLENPLDTPKISNDEILIEEIATNHPNTDLFNQDGNLGDQIDDDVLLPAYSYYIRIKSDTSLVNFDIQAAYNPYHFVVFRNSSEEYDKYLKSSLQKMFLYSDEDDPVQWFDEDAVYSNITNGVGIFGAYYDQTFYFTPLEIEE